MPNSSMPPINLNRLESIFSQLDIAGVRYGLGAKADIRNSMNPRSTGRLSTPINSISRIDCSGFIRYAIYHATDRFVFPDGSQIQRAWCEDHGLHKVDYPNVNRYMTDKRLFIAFIKPYTNGCGSVGHVWFVSQYDADTAADTMESHGGVGINSRPWNYRTLRNQVYSCYELPTI